MKDGNASTDDNSPVDLDLEKVLGKMPNKTFTSSRESSGRVPFRLPTNTTPADALDRVLRLPSVCSKRFLTTKVDRHVTGKADVMP